ncbi:hypothetical protein [Mucilaginibacter sp.]|nr:hypothetical protein [Mucilaginibacter sp.]
MQTTNIAIWILSVLDGALLVIVPLLDRRWYGHVRKKAVQYFFCNTSG